MRLIQWARKVLSPTVERDNSYEKVLYRQKVAEFNDVMVQGIEGGYMVSTQSVWDVRHCLAPVDRQFGKGLNLYGRMMFIPKGSWLVGKIHRYPCVNFLMQGKIALGVDAHGECLEAPAMFMSGAGTQKVGFAVEDVYYASAHITKGRDTDKLEDELTVETYGELGLLDRVEQLRIGVSK